MTSLQAASSPISTRAKKCVELFHGLIGLPHEPDQHPGEDVSVAEAVDCLGRFKIWAGNIGAFQRFESQSSLDYRLRDASKISAQIADLLDELAESIEDACSIISNVRENRTGSPIGARGHISSATNGVEEIPIPSDDEEMSEIKEIFESITDAINNLFRLSMIIRNNTSRDRYAKAAAAALSVPFDDQFDINHVEHKFPALKTKGKKWLITRLGKAITQRRQYLRYCREHHDKISREHHPTLKPQVVQPILIKPELVIGLHPDTQSVFSKPTSTLAPTQASTLLLTSDQIPEDVPAEDTQSQTSYATSNDEENTSHKLRVIKLEDVSKGVGHFECPYCWQIQASKNQKSWKKHVLADLKPYVCTFEKCELKLFPDHNTWFSHELKDHRKEWRCYFCTHDSFSSSTNYKAHLKSRHPQSFVEDQGSALLEMSQQPVVKVSPADCPFCDDWEKRLRDVNKHIPLSETLVVTPTQFKYHVGAHMEQLALFAIPRGYTEDGEADSGNAAPDAGSETSSLALSAPDSQAAMDLRACEDFLMKMMDDELLTAYFQKPHQTCRPTLQEISQALGSGRYNKAEDFTKGFGEMFEQFTDDTRRGRFVSRNLTEAEMKQHVTELRKEFIAFCADVQRSTLPAPVPADEPRNQGRAMKNPGRINFLPGDPGVEVHFRTTNGQVFKGKFKINASLEDLRAFVENYELMHDVPAAVSKIRQLGYKDQYDFTLRDIKTSRTFDEGNTSLDSIVDFVIQAGAAAMTPHILLTFDVVPKSRSPEPSHTDKEKLNIPSNAEAVTSKEPLDEYLLLQLTIDAANGLAKRDTFTLPNPHAVLFISAEKYTETTTIDKTLNPIWNEEFIFSIGRRSEIIIRVFDQRRSNKKDRGFLGSVRFRADDPKFYKKDSDFEAETYNIDLEADPFYNNLAVQGSLTFKLAKKWLTLGERRRLHPRPSQSSITKAQVISDGFDPPASDPDYFNYNVRSQLAPSLRSSSGVEDGTVPGENITTLREWLSREEKIKLGLENMLEALMEQPRTKQSNEQLQKVQAELHVSNRKLEELRNQISGREDAATHHREDLAGNGRGPMEDILSGEILDSGNIRRPVSVRSQGSSLEAPSFVSSTGAVHGLAEDLAALEASTATAGREDVPTSTLDRAKGKGGLRSLVSKAFRPLSSIFDNKGQSEAATEAWAVDSSEEKGPGETPERDLNPPERPTRAQQFEDEKQRLIQSCFSKMDEHGAATESYITHITILEDMLYTSSPPPPTSNRDKTKMPRVIVLAVQSSGRVRIHKAKENSNGSFSTSKTWDLTELTAINSFPSTLAPGVSRQETHETNWFGDVAFTLSLNNKPFYCQANSEKEKDFFIVSLVKVYTRYTGGQLPQLIRFRPEEREECLRLAAAEVRRIEEARLKFGEETDLKVDVPTIINSFQSVLNDGEHETIARVESLLPVKTSETEGVCLVCDLEYSAGADITPYSCGKHANHVECEGVRVRGLNGDFTCPICLTGPAKAANEPRTTSFREEFTAGDSSNDGRRIAGSTPSVPVAGATTKDKGKQRELVEPVEHPTIMTVFRGVPYDATHLDLDAEFLNELPADVREEVIMEAVTKRRQQVEAVAGLAPAYERTLSSMYTENEPPPTSEVQLHGSQDDLFKACHNGALDMAKRVLEATPQNLDARDPGSHTPLHIASIKGHIDIVKLLLKKGCMIDSVNESMDTPLTDAIENGHIEVAKVLLRAGANPYKCNSRGQDTLDLILLSEKDGIFDAGDAAELREAVANPWNMQHPPKDAVHAASTSGQLDVNEEDEERLALQMVADFERAESERRAERLDVNQEEQEEEERTSRIVATSLNAPPLPDILPIAWPMDRVLLWLEINGFSSEWQQTFQALNIHGAVFLGLDIDRVTPGHPGILHSRVYPRLARDFGYPRLADQDGYDTTAWETEGRRLRHLIRDIISRNPTKSSTESNRSPPSVSQREEKKVAENKYTANQAVTVTFSVHKKYHRAIIGPGGSKLREIIRNAGGSDDISEANRTVRFGSAASAEPNKITVEGIPEVVTKTITSIKQLVLKLESQQTLEVEVPAENHRELIGRGGITKQNLESTFNVKLDIPRQGSGLHSIKIIGQPDDIASAKLHIQKLTSLLAPLMSGKASLGSAETADNKPDHITMNDPLQDVPSQPVRSKTFQLDEDDEMIESTGSVSAKPSKRGRQGTGKAAILQPLGVRLPDLVANDEGELDHKLLRSNRKRDDQYAALSSLESTQLEGKKDEEGESNETGRSLESDVKGQDQDAEISRQDQKDDSEDQPAGIGRVSETAMEKLDGSDSESELAKVEEDEEERVAAVPVAEQNEDSLTLSSDDPKTSKAQKTDQNSQIQPKSIVQSRRASRPKVKTGCNNCKLRRVKCDEARPECMKCVRSGRHCPGYPAYKPMPDIATPIAQRPGVGRVEDDMVESKIYEYGDERDFPASRTYIARPTKLAGPARPEAQLVGNMAKGAAELLETVQKARGQDTDTQRNEEALSATWEEDEDPPLRGSVDQTPILLEADIAKAAPTSQLPRLASQLSASENTVGLSLTIRFTTPIPDLSLHFPHRSPTRISELKELIRSKADGLDTTAPLLLFYKRRLLEDWEVLDVALPQGTGEVVFVDCAFGGVLPKGPQKVYGQPFDHSIPREGDENPDGPESGIEETVSLAPEPGEPAGMNFAGGSSRGETIPTRLELVIIFTTSIPNLSLRININDTTSAMDLKELIRAEIEIKNGESLQLSYKGRILEDGDMLAVAIPSTRGQKVVYLDCSFGPALPPHSRHSRG